MQASKIYLNGELFFELPPESSEWLFSVKFWDGINKECNSFFDQYEEDDVSELTGETIVLHLEGLCNSLSVRNEDVVRFSRGWGQNGELFESIDRVRLLNSLSEFKDALSGILHSSNEVSLSL